MVSQQEVFDKSAGKGGGKRDDKKQGAGETMAFIRLFLFMLACTGISRIYDSMAVPKVKTSETRRKAVETFIEGSGIVKVKEKQIYPVFAGLRIRQVAVVPGREVQEGDILFCYDEESMAEMEEGLREEIAAIDLTISKEQIAQETYSGITQTELARREFELAREELEEERAAVEEEQKSMKRN